MDVYLLDGTYELFRYHFALPSHMTAGGREVAATRGVLSTVLSMFEEGTRYLGVATDHVIESFRNDMWPGYKSSAGVAPELLQQFPLIEEALTAMGVVVWPMVELEADDALAAGAAAAATDPQVERVYICSPDKDLGQCVREDGRVLQIDRRQRKVSDADAVRAKFGVGPASVADYLALVGDSADGYPGLPGWGAKTAAAVLDRFDHIEDIPASVADWGLNLRGSAVLAQTLVQQRDRALLFKDIATVRTEPPPFKSVDELRWAGPTPEFRALAESLDAPEVAVRAAVVAKRIREETG